MSAVDEDTELRDLLVQTLDKNGVLGKIKAELRANIFLALEEEDKVKHPTPLKNKLLNKLLETQEGIICVSVINEFLKKYNLEYTSAVFQPETNIGDSLLTNEALRSRLSFPEHNISKDSILCELIKSNHSPSRPADTQNIKPNQLQFLKIKFESFTVDESNVVARKDISAVFSLACPRFNPSMLEAFVNEEMQNNHNTSVSFGEFIAMFNKLHEMCGTMLSVGEWESNVSTIPLIETNVKSPETLSNFSRSQEFKLEEDLNRSLPQGMEIATSFHGGMDEDDFFDDKSSPRDQLNNKNQSKSDNVFSEKSEATNENWSESRKKVAKLEYSAEYNDDFQSESNVSISEDIQDDLSGLSSERDSNLDLTDDQTVSEAPKADYMESVNLHYS